ncbi:hypothetical protein [Rubellicoccus peritrichatus]|uniref:Uncharacterized protein n=1 Tax=Rubellicoccus peritrichatus TaxID=3080537 RepID=A0AAQ3LAH4_9BACT|nr:hypothetical protein [Puniceicoccus sp. CR14]WOO42260.1 hypothetical protein RZN69_04105 [Puniceicoccus sp. CR14]
MKIGKALSDTTSATSSILILVLGITAFFMWSSKSNLEWEIEDLTLRDIQLIIKNKEGKKLKEAFIGVEPMYSFDEIKPKHTLTILGEGEVRLSVVFVRRFKIQVGANGYKTRTIEYGESDPSELQITLVPIDRDNE